jgi:hypothetical protein
MNTIKGMIRDGLVVKTEPANLPDGTEVEIVPVGLSSSVDEVGPMGPDEIARTLAAMDKIEPFEMTTEERAAIEADQQARKEWEKVRFHEHADRLRRMWERDATSSIPGSLPT